MLIDILRFYVTRLLDFLTGLYDIYVGILKVAGVGFLSYMGVMIVVDLPLHTIEAIMKKKIPAKVTNRIKLALTVCATLYFTYILYID